MKLLICCLLYFFNLSFSSGRRYQVLPQQTYYVNPSHASYVNPSHASYINPSQAGYYNPYQAAYFNPSQNGYLNPLSTSGLYSGYNAGIPYSPSYLYSPGINSQLLNPAVNYDQLSHQHSKTAADPTTLTKSHVQYRPQGVVRNSQNSLGLSNIYTPYPTNYLQQSLTRSLCSSCSCEVDFGCSYNCEKCSALCHSCSCEESQGCRYNCDKCQNSDSRTTDEGQTTEMPTQDSTDSSDDTLDTTEDTTDNSAGDTTESSEDVFTTESVDADPATESQSGTDEAETEASVTETSDVESATEQQDEDSTTVTEEGEEENEEVQGGLINPTFPLGSVGDTDIAENGLGSGSSSSTDDNSETGVTEAAENNGTDCSPLESLEVNLCSWGPSCQTVVNAVYPNCNYNCTSCKINQVGGCVASSGSAAGQTCVFPFIYNGVAYNGCAPLHSEERVLDFWCSTKTDINGIHITGPFEDPGKYVGMCDSSCPRDVPGFRIQPGFKLQG